MGYSTAMSKVRTTHDTALVALIPAEDRADYESRVMALVSKNRILEVIEAARKSEGISKKKLAELAGLEPSSVRRLLTAQTANPTAENVFRLLRAAHVKVQVTLPSGDRVAIA